MKKVWGLLRTNLAKNNKKRVHLMKHMDTWHIFWHPLNSSTPDVRFCGFEALPLHMEVLKFLSPLIDITLRRLNSEKRVAVNTFSPRRFADRPGRGEASLSPPCFLLSGSGPDTFSHPGRIYYYYFFISFVFLLLCGEKK